VKTHIYSMTKSNTHDERLGFHASDTDTNFWAGIDWLD